MTRYRLRTYLDQSGRDFDTPEELAERLKVPVSWVYKKSAASAFPVLRCGRYLRFSWPEVCAWLREKRT